MQKFVLPINKLGRTKTTKKQMMIKIKWRQNINSNFEFYSNIPREDFKRFIGPITPFNSEQVEFKIEGEFIDLNGQTVKGLHLAKMRESFYLIEDNILLIYHSDYPIAILDNYNIKEFKIGNNPWQNISSAYFFNQFCIVNLTNKVFAIPSQNSYYLKFIENDEDFSNMEEKSLSEFYGFFKIRQSLYI